MQRKQTLLNRRPGLLTALMAVTLLAVMAACGGAQEDTADDDDVAAESAEDAATGEPAEEGTAEPAATAEEAPAELETVQMSVGAHSIAFMPLYIALQAGYYEEEGYDVEMITLAGGAVSMNAVSGNEVTIGWSGGPGAVLGPVTGEPTRFIAVSVDQFASQVTVSNAFLEGLDVTPESSLSDKIRALEGAQIAVSSPGSGSDQFIRLLLTQEGLDPDRDVEIVGLGGDPAAHIGALETGRVDVSILSPPTSYATVVSDVGVLFIDPLNEEVPVVSGMTNHAGSANVQTLEEEPEKVRGLLRAITRAMNLIHESPEEAAEFLRLEFPELEQEVFDASFEGIIGAVPMSPEVTEESVTNTLDFLRAVGEQEIPDDVSFDDIADPMPAREAAESVE